MVSSFSRLYQNVSTQAAALIDAADTPPSFSSHTPHLLPPANARLYQTTPSSVHPLLPLLPPPPHLLLLSPPPPLPPSFPSLPPLPSPSSSSSCHFLLSIPSRLFVIDNPQTDNRAILAAHLNAHFPGRCLLLNLSEREYSLSPFRVVAVGRAQMEEGGVLRWQGERLTAQTTQLQTASQITPPNEGATAQQGRYLCLTYKALPAAPVELCVEACFELLAWLIIHPDNVVVMHCYKGYSRSSVFAACFLYFCGCFDSTVTALRYVCQSITASLNRDHHQHDGPPLLHSLLYANQPRSSSTAAAESVGSFAAAESVGSFAAAAASWVLSSAAAATELVAGGKEEEEEGKGRVYICPSQWRYLAYFETAVGEEREEEETRFSSSEGVSPMADSHPPVQTKLLSRIILYGIPFFERPTKPPTPTTQEEEEERDSSSAALVFPTFVFRPYLELVYTSFEECAQWYAPSDACVVFTVEPPLTVAGDVLLRVCHLRSDGQSISALRAAFDTDYVEDCCLHLPRAQLDGASVDSRFPADSFLDIIFLQADDTPPPPPPLAFAARRQRIQSAAKTSNYLRHMFLVEQQAEQQAAAAGLLSESKRSIFSGATTADEDQTEFEMSTRPPHLRPPPMTANIYSEENSISSRRSSQEALLVGGGEKKEDIGGRCIGSIIGGGSMAGFGAAEEESEEEDDWWHASTAACDDKEHDVVEEEEKGETKEVTLLASSGRSDSNGSSGSSSCSGSSSGGGSSSSGSSSSSISGGSSGSSSSSCSNSGSSSSSRCSSSGSSSSSSGSSSGSDSNGSDSSGGSSSGGSSSSSSSSGGSESTTFLKPFFPIFW
eukprot:GHVS01033179.1.p1 GENE.GHVS01033179.1~~GHVS01033179.1.p1  ORF type:complete len:885 (+),score=355.85 GHVS01033179.1:158-2656(+)